MTAASAELLNHVRCDRSVIGTPRAGFPNRDLRAARGLIGDDALSIHRLLMLRRYRLYLDVARLAPRLQMVQKIQGDVKEEVSLVKYSFSHRYLSEIFVIRNAAIVCCTKVYRGIVLMALAPSRVLDKLLDWMQTY